MAGHNFGVTHLPDDLKLLIFQFLHPKDALCFASSCRTWNEAISVTCTQIVQRFTCNGNSMHGEIPQRFQRLPLPLSSRKTLHTVGLTLHWRDQGWGNLKGQIYVTATTENDQQKVVITPNNLAQDRFHGDRLVYESPIAGHEEQPLSFDFRPELDEIYHLWAKPGGGGGHSLTVENVRVWTLDVTPQVETEILN